MISKNDKITIAAILIILALMGYSWASYPAALCVSDSSGVSMADCTSAVLFPVGTTAQRPGSPVLGYARINSDTLMQEVWNGSSWTLLPLTKTYNFAPSHAIQTVAAAGNGFQLATNRDAEVTYSVSISTTATIGGASTGYVVLEIAATNSSTASDWKEVGRITNSQTITLAIALQSVQIISGALNGIIPAGYYARLRSVNSSGTPTYAFLSGEEVY